jgi:hypothetical protein
VAGVAVSVTTNFLPSGFESEPSDSSIQGALAATDNPRQEFEIQAATYGKGLPLEGISDVQPGSTQRVREALVAASLASGAQEDTQAPPQALLFGQPTAGVSLLGTSSVEPGMLHTYVGTVWVTEAIGRIWIARVAKERPLSENSFSATQPFTDGLRISLDVAPPVIASTLKFAPYAGTLSQVPTAWINVSTPPWWNGQCDSARTGSHALSTPNTNGLAVCAPNPDVPASGFPVISGVAQPLEFECVELSKRWLYQAYGQSAYAANGNQMVSNYPGTNLAKVNNGTSGQRPFVGDVISFNNSQNGAGHTAVVYSSSIDASGNGSVGVIEENGASSGYEPFNMVSWTLQASGVLTPIAWLHDSTVGYPPLMAYVDGAGNFSAKQGSLLSGWVPEATNAVAISVTYTATGAMRLSYVDSSGELRVKEGSLYAGWWDLAGGVKAVSLSGDLVGAIDSSNTFTVKQGPLNAVWVPESGPVQAIALTYTSAGTPRLGILDSNNNFSVKEGSLYATWTTVDYNVAQIGLTGDLLGDIDRYGQMEAEQGSITSGWVSQASQVTALALAYPESGLRIGYLDTSAGFHAKEASLVAAPLLATSPATVISMAGDLMGAVDSTQTFSVKQGGLGADWVPEVSPASQIALAGN